MAEQTTAVENPSPGKEADLSRVLVPSPIGFVGIELAGETVNRVIWAPVGRERKLFPPLADLKRSQRTDFLDEVIGRFSEYLAGARKKFQLDFNLKAHDLTAFSRRVLKETAKVPYGRSRSYRQIASASGMPSAYRQVLAILMNNPLPLIVPCHRVVTNKSGVGSYIGGVKRKQWLLKMEQKNLPLL